MHWPQHLLHSPIDYATSSLLTPLKSPSPPPPPLLLTRRYPSFTSTPCHRDELIRRTLARLTRPHHISPHLSNTYSPKCGILPICMPHPPLCPQSASSHYLKKKPCERVPLELHSFLSTPWHSIRQQSSFRHLARHQSTGALHSCPRVMTCSVLPEPIHPSPHVTSPPPPPCLILASPLRLLAHRHLPCTRLTAHDYYPHTNTQFTQTT